MPVKRYYLSEAKTTFKASGGDVLFTFASTAVQALAVSDQWDRGSGAKPGLYHWRIKVRLDDVAGRTGDTALIFLIQTDDATDIPGRVGASDTEIASARDLLYDLDVPIGAVVNDALIDLGGTEFIVTGLCFIFSRYVSLAIYNEMDVIFDDDETGLYFELSPFSSEEV